MNRLNVIIKRKYPFAEFIAIHIRHLLIVLNTHQVKISLNFELFLSKTEIYHRSEIEII